MSEQIREQVSAFLDGELPSSETELLLKRLIRDAELRESFGRYALIGESMRGGGNARLSQGFTARVNRAIDGEPLVAGVPQSPSMRWWRPFAGAAVAAGVTAVAIVALQQRAVTPGRSPLPMMVQNLALPQTVGTPGPKEALSYTVPVAAPNAPAALPAARLTNYVFAHSKYSSVMGQNDVLNDLLSAADAEDGGTKQDAGSKGAHDGTP